MLVSEVKPLKDTLISTKFPPRKIYFDLLVKSNWRGAKNGCLLFEWKDRQTQMMKG